MENFNTKLLEFLSMGGYAFYVWTAYGIAAVVMLWMLFSSLSQQKDILTKLKKARRA
jgi:heme exporter protein D